MSEINRSGTKCPKCGSTSFELKDDLPSNSKYDFYYLRCQSCQTFLTAFETMSVNDQLEEIKGLIENLNLPI
jgi:hypothetical protein